MHKWLTLAVVAGLAVCWPLVAAAVDHGAFDRILRDHVKRGRVDYAAIKARAKKDLDRYVHALSQAKLDGLSRGEKLALYLNAYNANVIKAVVERYPLASVAKVKGFFDRKKIRVAGSTLTLNALEHQVIRKRFAEPRIHFALVCAARSCPPLPSRAFSAKRLEQDLERLTRSFLNSREGARITRGRVTVSKLFEWYGEDFTRAAGSVGAFVAKYRDQGAERFRRGPVGFHPYDWALNDR
jgi:hypothetical protein